MQGVWFRGWIEREAAGLGLSGWVRNQRDGRVEAVFAGNGDAVERMLDLCWQGPPMANVERVVIDDVEVPVEPGFRRLPNVG